MESESEPEIPVSEVKILASKTRISILKKPRKKERRLIAIDKTKIKLEKKLIFVWAAIDVDTKECLAIWASEHKEF